MTTRQRTHDHGMTETTITLPEPRDAWVVMSTGGPKPSAHEIGRVQLLACRTYQHPDGAYEAGHWLAVSHPETEFAAYLDWWEDGQVYFTREQAERWVQTLEEKRASLGEQSR